MTLNPTRTIYLSNKDILKEIHHSKNTYCWYKDRVNDHQYDIILPSVNKINQRTIAEARRNRATRLTKETGEEVNEKKIANTELVFRIMTWEHIPIDDIKQKKADAKAQEEWDEEVCELLEAKGWETLRIAYDPPLSEQKLSEIVKVIERLLSPDEE